MIAACTKQVWDADEVYDDFTKDELIDFLQSMDIKMFTKMKEFLTETLYIIYRYQDI